MGLVVPTYAYTGNTASVCGCVPQPHTTAVQVSLVHCNKLVKCVQTGGHSLACDVD